MKVAFIGGGVMAEAILSRALSDGMLTASDVCPRRARGRTERGRRELLWCVRDRIQPGRHGRCGPGHCRGQAPAPGSRAR